jgi:hypothetical protein
MGLRFKAKPSRMDLSDGSTSRSGFPICPVHGLMVEVKLMTDIGELQLNMGPYSY